MEEGKRIAYLERLGVPVWYATQPLEGALATPLCDLEEMFEPSSTNDFPKTNDANDKSGDTPNRHAKQDITESLSSPVPLVQEHPSESIFPQASNDDANKSHAVQKLKSSAQLHLSFAKISLGKKLLLLVELGDEKAPGFSAAETRLLSAVLTALNLFPDTQGSLDSQVVRWPQLKGQGLPTDAQAAGEFLFAYLEAQHQRSSFDVLLLLGDKLKEAYYYLDDSRVTGARKYSVTTGSSLYSLLQQPSKKAALWGSIKHFRK